MRPWNLQIVYSILAAIALQAPAWGDDPISFSRDIAPILAESCYQCHGPDESQNDSGFRLDTKSSAYSKLGSGAFAIAPNRPFESEIVQRMLADDDSKMPPAESNYSIKDEEIGKIKSWIAQGAKWDRHWAFEPVRKSKLPSVKNNNWPLNGMDYYVLSQLEANKLTPALSADPETLRRRLYTNVLGFVPPAQSVADTSYESVVDRLLASPRFGEKWGRHWLDVARYADSNGADENHYYPNAYHYRDWVIQASNLDLPFDQFVSHQLAGDLYATEDAPESLAATGYLAIGIKILAEKDPKKKRMDMIDEQLDTLGQTFLGLTIGCARCHDHKFDPIPTKDYYALAGILHSTEVADQELFSKSLAKEKKKIESMIESISQKLEARKKSLKTKVGAASFIARQAEKFDRGNVVIDDSNYGKGIGIISDPGSQENFAEYDFTFKQEKSFLIQLRYAAARARPGRILVNKKVVIENAIAKTTGSWMPDTQTWFTEGRVDFAAGKNTLRIESKPLMSHIDQFRLIDVTQETSIKDELKVIAELENQIKKARSKIPMARKVMAVKDGNPNNISIHLRGSHLSLGDKVDRGFLSRLGDKNRTNIPQNASGRKELARWLTQTQSQTSQLVARVIVNRIWHWYFRKGLVDSPNEFGIRGGKPSHPALLDYLANRLVESNWSLKTIHREILLSRTYRMASRPTNRRYEIVDPENRLLSFHPIKRMTAEIYRDSILSLRGDIDWRVGGKPPQVTSQNPSPEKLDANQMVYDSSRRRSVYLPVVRSNTYDLFVNFDFPDASATNGRRNETIVPTQALLLMNGGFVHESSIRILEQLKKERRLRPEQVFEKIFGRKPLSKELKLAEEFVKEQDEITFKLLIHTYLMSNDFLYVQ